MLGGPGEESTHLENRIGEPCANPYLYLAAQLAAGLDGIERGLQPGGLAQDPHADSAVPLPRDLAAAVAAAQDSALTRTLLGKHLHDCLVRLKRTELSRFEQWRATAPPTAPGDVTAWEHREYFGAY
ncbi:hypothetical protein WKI68_25850 [Streptomyces sp. MS1.HAVA.3]|uniref:GS catalytic domain-containing protein n=1 Tax=Streptomyces caledonius TaxID=3134107 RepID=A0ABU8U8K5_9ACTN